MKGFKLGFIGGGQLGRMLTFSAKQMGFDVVVLDKTPNSPAGQVSDEQIVGELTDESALRELAGKAGVLTYEIEHIAVEPLKKMADEGVKIYPAPVVLEMIQDKYLQKKCLAEAGVPTSDFVKVNDELLGQGGLSGVIEERFGYPVVQKTCKGGYDGKGVLVIKDADDLEVAFGGDSFLEAYVEFEKELAVNVARNVSGEIVCHPVSEMVFNEDNICDTVVAPARISDELAKRAEEVGIQAIEALGDGAVGIFGVEMFLTKDGEILVNEIAPRPHNSAHYSIEACVTSQYEQHIRAIMDMPLGSTELMKPSAMLNVLGEDDEGKHLFENLNEILKVPGASFHYYGKAAITPLRKIGHITVVADSADEALAKIDKIRPLAHKG